MSTLTGPASPTSLSAIAEPLASARDRVLAGDAAAVRAVSELSVAGEPDRDRGAVRALARSDPRLCRHRLARPCRVLRHRRLYRGPVFQIRLGRAAFRADRGGRDRRARRLRLELHHRALPPSHADHDHARPRAAAARGGQQRELADRRLRRAAGRDASGRCSACSNSISTATRPMPMRWPCCSCCSWARGG